MCQQGDIAWVRVEDPQGRNPKIRPIIIISDTEEISADAPLVGVAVSGVIPDPVPSDYVALPWQNGGHPVTNLYKPSVAVCSWIISIQRSEISNISGRVPAAKLLKIMEQVAGEPPEDIASED